MKSMHWTAVAAFVTIAAGNGLASAELPGPGFADTDQPGSGVIYSGNYCNYFGDPYAAAEWTASGGDVPRMKLNAAGCRSYTVLAEIVCGGQIVSQPAVRPNGEAITVSAACDGIGPVTEYFGEVYLND